MSLLRSTAKQQGVRPEAIKACLDKWTEYGMDLHSFMLLKHGKVISEVYWQPYQPHIPHLLNSLSKSFTSTAIGIAVEEQKLSLDDPVISFFPRYVNEAMQDSISALKVKHLLSMSTGHAEDTTAALLQSEDWVETFFSIPLTYEPGTHFLYNTGATYMLSAVIHATTGEQLLDYLQPRLFEPLGLSDITTETCPKGIHTGGFGMSVKTEDIAKFGLLYLQNGIWNGQQLIPEWYVKLASSKQISNGNAADSDWTQGYGYQFWRCRHQAYRADGAFGQFCIVVPEHDAVIVTTSGVMEMQDMLDVIWEELLPGLSVEPEHINAAAEDELRAAIESYRYVPAYKSNPSAKPAYWSNSSYKIADNKSGITQLKFNFNEHEATLQLYTGEHEQTIHIGHGKWISNTLLLEGLSLPVALCGTWVSFSQYAITIRMLNKPYTDQWLCHFSGADFKLSLTRNVWIIPNSPLSKPYLPTLTGAVLLS